MNSRQHQIFLLPPIAILGSPQRHLGLLKILISLEKYQLMGCSQRPQAQTPLLAPTYRRLRRRRGENNPNPLPPHHQLDHRGLQDRVLRSQLQSKMSTRHKARFGLPSDAIINALFVYPRDKDSVLQVDREAYSTCNTSSYIAKFDDGNTVITFSRSGPFYFISGVEANCLKKESLVIVVLADRSKRASQLILAPSPSPASTLSPPIISSPSLPPSEGEVTPPSPSPSEGEGETTAPLPPPPNGASLKLVGFMGSFGALIGCFFFCL